MTTRTIVDVFRAQVSRSAERPALRHRSGGLWLTRTFRQWAHSVDELAAYLLGLGIEPGDRVALLSQTRMAWVEVDLAIVHAGAATVPLYPTLQPDTVGQILADSGARVAFVEDPVQLSKLFDPRAGDLPNLEHLIVLDRVSRLARPDAEGRLDVWVHDVLPEGAPRCVALEDARERGRARLEAKPDELSARARTLGPDALAAVYYTSGTSGDPKGVELTHANFVSQMEAIHSLGLVGSDDEQLLFLPLAHIVAKLTVTLQLEVGFVTSFSESIEQAADDCAEVRPTFLAGVPRVYEKIAETILGRVEAASPLERRAFATALATGRKVSALEREGKRPSRWLGLTQRSANRFVFSRVRERLGGRVRFMLSGAAPLSAEVAELFHAMGLLVLEGYGLTESTGACTLNTPEAFRFGTVGRPVPGVEVKLAPDAEILVRGPSVARGYFGREEETAEVFDDGWLRTGDVGTLESGGFLRITDRKKDLIITAGGKNIAPQRIEQRLKQSRYIDRAVVLGDQRKFLVALLMPRHEALMSWAEREGIKGDASILARHPRARDLIANEVERVNASLAPFETIKRFEMIDDDLSEASGELTVTGKVRRDRVATRYADLVDSLYDGLNLEIEELG